MNLVDVFVRYSDLNIKFDKVATLSNEDGLIYNDEGSDFKAHLKTTGKFALLTAASPLISLARLVRSAAFIFSNEREAAGREFIGALATPIIAAGCLLGSLLSSIVYPIFLDQASFYVTMRRTYAFFEAWVNGIDLKSPILPSYSQRINGFWDAFKGRIWTTAPCMQPLLENGFSNQGGLQDPARVQKMFPFLKVNDVFLEYGQVVIESEYANEKVAYTACDGAYEHRKMTDDLCCCYRVETVYDRILCCELAQGSCTSKFDSGDSCGIVSCGCGGLGACCCYVKENDTLVSLNTGCFGPEGPCCIAGVERRIV